MNNETKLAKIEERLSKATPGKWIRRTAYIHPESFDNLAVIDCLSQRNAYDWNANAEFICNAREDIQFLVDEVRRLNESLDEIRRIASNKSKKRDTLA